MNVHKTEREALLLSLEIAGKDQSLFFSEGQIEEHDRIDSMEKKENKAIVRITGREIKPVDLKDRNILALYHYIRGKFLYYRSDFTASSEEFVRASRVFPKPGFIGLCEYRRACALEEAGLYVNGIECLCAADGCLEDGSLPQDLALFLKFSINYLYAKMARYFLFSEKATEFLGAAERAWLELNHAASLEGAFNPGIQLLRGMIAWESLQYKADGNGKNPPKEKHFSEIINHAGVSDIEKANALYQRSQYYLRSYYNAYHVCRAGQKNAHLFYDSRRNNIGSSLEDLKNVEKIWLKKEGPDYIDKRGAGYAFYLRGLHHVANCTFVSEDKKREFNKSQEAFYTALKIFSEIRYRRGLALTCIELAGLYRLDGFYDFPKALDYLKKAEDHASFDNPFLLGRILLKIRKMLHEGCFSNDAIAKYRGLFNSLFNDEELNKPFSFLISGAKNKTWYPPDYGGRVEEIEALEKQPVMENDVDAIVGDKFKNYKSGGNDRTILGKINSFARINRPVFISGETGTGKEVVAKAIHDISKGKDAPFVKVNCAAIPADLLESELFGHEKGSFTGALAQEKGKFEAANNGTIFLDEIGEIPLFLQAKLLRVLDDHEFYRVGGTKTVQVNIRIITATNRDLKGLMRSGGFRKDLYYRIKVLSCHLPPLRERLEDVPALLQYFMNKYNEENTDKINGIEPALMREIMKLHFPGNVRQLRNLLAIMASVTEGDIIRLSDAGDLIQNADYYYGTDEGNGMTDAGPEGNTFYRMDRLIEAVNESNRINAEISRSMMALAQTAVRKPPKAGKKSPPRERDSKGGESGDRR